MSEQETLSKKQELLEILQEAKEHLETLPDEEINKRKTKMQAESGIGYYITSEQFHMWIVKMPGAQGPRE